MCGSKEHPSPQQGGLLEIPWERWVSKATIFEGK